MAQFILGKYGYEGQIEVLGYTLSIPILLTSFEMGIVLLVLCKVGTLSKYLGKGQLAEHSLRGKTRLVLFILMIT